MRPASGGHEEEDANQFILNFGKGWNTDSAVVEKGLGGTVLR